MLYIIYITIICEFFDYNSAMRTIFIALAASIIIHILFFLNYSNKQLLENKEKEEIKQEKTDVKFVKLKKEKSIEKVAQSAPPKVEVPVILEKKIEPKIPPKVEAPKKQKQIQKPIDKKAKINQEKKIKEAKEFQNKVLSEQVVKNQNTIQDNLLENFLSQKETISKVDKEILSELEKLYGEEYKTFTKVQKAYLEKNLNNFQTITQRVLNRLGYPRLAAKLGIGGINAVEFMFHPDGSISGLKILGSSQYTILDDYTLHLIKIAYKDYPKPETSTKLRFRVFYKMY